MLSLLSTEKKKFILILCSIANLYCNPANAVAGTMPGHTTGHNKHKTTETDTIISNTTDIRIAGNGINKSRLYFTLAGSVAGWAGMTIYLYRSVYINELFSSFRFINDLGYNMDMDKSGHLFSSYTLSIAGIHLMKQTGMDRKRAAWIGGSYGTIFLSTKEIMDGFRKDHGFSLPDMAFNIAGSALAISQELILGNQVVRIKYSYHESGPEKETSDYTERNLAGRMIYNYNGQTNWLSANIKSLDSRMEVFPGWLNIAFGHSVSGITGGCSCPSAEKNSYITSNSGYRQFFLAPDIDLSAIETRSRFINGLLRTLNFIKIPSPAMEYNRVDGFRLHLLYF